MNCAWSGLQSNLREHVKVAHPKGFTEASKIRSVKFEDNIVNITSCFGHLFVHYKRVRDGKLYCAVQLFGTCSEASSYKCEFTFGAANCIEQISKTLLVRGYSEDFETIFNSGKCVCLDEAVVRHYIVENKLNMTITLSKV
jgi:hypothetical protein